MSDEIKDLTEEKEADKASDSSIEDTKSTDTPKRRLYKRDIIRYVIMAICAGIFIFSAIKIINILKEYKKGKDTYTGIKSEAYVEGTTASVPTETAEGETIPDYMRAWPAIDFDALEAINSDVIGWIDWYTYGSSKPAISYPVAQGTDNDFYLLHSITKDPLVPGTIFMDYRTASDFSSPNTFIYGHRMNDGSMFAPLLKYDDKDFFDKQEAAGLNYIYFYTREAIFVYKVFAITDVDLSEHREVYQIISANELSEYAKTLKGYSRYDTKVAVPEDCEHILTLYTCQATGENTTRHLVQTYLVDKINR